MLSCKDVNIGCISGNVVAGHAVVKAEVCYFDAGEPERVFKSCLNDRRCIIGDIICGRLAKL